MGDAFINKVDNNESKYNIKEYTDAMHARSLQHIIGWPNTRDFITYTENNMIPNCLITKADILHAEDIFGTDVGALEGKTTHRKTRPLQMVLEDLPTGMLERHSNVTIETDMKGRPHIETQDQYKWY